MKKAIKTSKKYLITIISFAIILVACIGATIGITMAYFGDVKSGSADITLGASIYFAKDSENQKEINMTTDLTGSAVPSQTVTVTTSLNIQNGTEGQATKGVLCLEPVFSDKNGSGVTCTFVNGTTYDISADSVITGVKFLAYKNRLYLVNSTLTTDGLSTDEDFEKVALAEVGDNKVGKLSCVIKITIPTEIGNDAGGKTCSLSITAKVLQSAIYTDASNTAASVTIGGFSGYFNDFNSAA